MKENVILVHGVSEEDMEEVRKLSKQLDYSLSRYTLRAIKHQLQMDKRSRLGESDGGNDGE
jgi:hypothetical protein